MKTKEQEVLDSISIMEQMPMLPSVRRISPGKLATFLSTLVPEEDYLERLTPKLTRVGEFTPKNEEKCTEVWGCVCPLDHDDPAADGEEKCTNHLAPAVLTYNPIDECWFCEKCGWRAPNGYLEFSTPPSEEKLTVKERMMEDIANGSFVPKGRIFDLVRPSEEKKCEPDDCVYTSNPPQNRCKICRKFWQVGKQTPICVSPTPPDAWEEEFDGCYGDLFTESDDCKGCKNSFEGDTRHRRHCIVDVKDWLRSKRKEWENEARRLIHSRRIANYPEAVDAIKDEARTTTLEEVERVVQEAKKPEKEWVCTPTPTYEDNKVCGMGESCGWKYNTEHNQALDDILTRIKEMRTK